MSSEIVIKVENLSKCYHIYENPRDRLKQFILPSVQRCLGRTPKNYYREFWALENISFEVARGETVGIVGVNGSGKSTLLKLICETLSESSGVIEKKGRVAALLELGTGFNPEFTGKENVYQNARILGLSKDEIDSKYDDIVKFADIGEFIGRPVKTYSSGMYVRLAFSVIANVDADILIIDEALAVGDAFFTQKCMRFLRDFKKKGTILFVSHSTGAIVNLCDRALWLEKGQMKSFGEAKQVCEHYLANRYNSCHKKNSDTSGAAQVVNSSKYSMVSVRELDQYRDMRAQFLNSTNLRNDIRVVDFDGLKRGFGNGGADITYAGLEDLDGKRVSWMVGGEAVRIVVRAKILVSCSSVVIGFNIKDRLGQVLIGQNTYLDTCLDPVHAKPGDTVEAAFLLRLPIFPRGNYVVDVAVAEGHPPDVVQLQWAHDAFILESQSSSVVSGLIGLLFDQVEIKNKTKDIAHDS